jgi:hypothetical protein
MWDATAYAWIVGIYTTYHGVFVFRDWIPVCNILWICTSALAF